MLEKLRNDKENLNYVILVRYFAHLDKLMVVSSTTFSTALFDLGSKVHGKFNNADYFQVIHKRQKSCFFTDSIYDKYLSTSCPSIDLFFLPQDSKFSLP